MYRGRESLLSYLFSKLQSATNVEYIVVKQMVINTASSAIWFIFLSYSHIDLHLRVVVYDVGMAYTNSMHKAQKPGNFFLIHANEIWLTFTQPQAFHHCINYFYSLPRS